MSYRVFVQSSVKKDCKKLRSNFTKKEKSSLDEAFALMKADPYKNGEPKTNKDYRAIGFNGIKCTYRIAYFIYKCCEKPNFCKKDIKPTSNKCDGLIEVAKIDTRESFNQLYYQKKSILSGLK